jgi:hypothetical protein
MNGVCHDHPSLASLGSIVEDLNAINYKTMNLAGLFIRERGVFMRSENKGHFYHDGRFQTLLDVINSYNTRFKLGLTDQEKSDLVEYLKSL